MKKLNMNDKDRRQVYCSFCGKTQDEIYRLISGPGVYICDECVNLCNIILADEKSGIEARST